MQAKEVQNTVHDSTSVPTTLWWRHYEPGVRLLRVRKSQNGTCGFHITRSKWDPYPWVSDVDVGTPAYVCGLKPGDCILEVNGEDVLGLRVADVASLVRANADAHGDAVADCEADATIDAAADADVRRQSAITLLVWRNGAGSTANKCQPQSLCCGPMPRSLQRLSLVLQAILSLIECPVCMDTITPPTMQCQNGHLLCLPCRIRAEKCPVCRECYTPRRALTAEQIYNAIANGFQLGGNERKLRELLFNNRSTAHVGGTRADGGCGLATIQLPAAVQANVATTNTTNGMFKYLPQQQQQQQVPKSDEDDGDDDEAIGGVAVARDTALLRRELQTLRQRATGHHVATSSWSHGRNSDRILPLPLSRLTAAISAPSLLYVHQRRPCSSALDLRRAVDASDNNNGNSLDSSSSSSISSSGVYSSDDDGDLSSSTSTLPIGGDEQVEAPSAANDDDVDAGLGVGVDDDGDVVGVLKYLCPCGCATRFADSTALRAHVNTDHRLPVLSFGMASAQLTLPLRAPLDDCIVVLHVPAATTGMTTEAATRNELPKECWIRLQSQRKAKQQLLLQQQQNEFDDDALKHDKCTTKVTTTTTTTTSTPQSTTSSSSTAALLMTQRELLNCKGLPESDAIIATAMMLAPANVSADFVLATRLTGNNGDGKAFSAAPSANAQPAAGITPRPSTESPMQSSSSSPSSSSSATVTASTARQTDAPAAAAAASTAGVTKITAADVSVMQLSSTNNNRNGNRNNANGQLQQQQQQQHNNQALDHQDAEEPRHDGNLNGAALEMRSIVHSMETTTWQAIFKMCEQQQQEEEQKVTNNNNEGSANNDALLTTRKNDLSVISVMQQACQSPPSTSASTRTPTSTSKSTMVLQQQQQHQQWHQSISVNNDVDLQLHIDVLHRLDKK